MVISYVYELHQGEKYQKTKKKIIPVDWKDFIEEIGNCKDNSSSDRTTVILLCNLNS